MMDDLISRFRDYQIEWLTAHNDIEFCEEEEKLIIGFLKDTAESFMRENPSAQQWIPCAERLPDQNGKYLVVGRQKAINILKFDGGRWYGKWGVVAWMPLPDCYQGDGNNEM